MSSRSNLADRFGGLLVGTAVGDSLGLPREGLTASRAVRLFGPPTRHAFLFGRGMVSDDTEHSTFVAQCLVCHPKSVEKFQRRLSWCLRLWLLSLPAGLGFATLRSILRLWMGVPASRAGVASAGNGPAMRSAPIGAFFFNSPDSIRQFVSVSTRLTHTDERAEIGALAVAYLAALSVVRSSEDRPTQAEFLELLRSAGASCAEWKGVIQDIEYGIVHGLSVREFAARIGQPDFVSGYVFHTVPVVAYSWFRHFGDFERSLREVLDCGGDADTSGAIIGALAGSVVGYSRIPKPWVDGIFDWPRGIAFLVRLSGRFAAVQESMQAGAQERYFWPAVFPRNLLFFVIVLFHGFRRLFPPFR